MFTKTKQNMNDEVIVYQRKGKVKEIWRRYKKNKGAMIGLIMLVIIAALLIFGPLLVPYDLAITQNSSLMLKGPSSEHIFGNDGFGRDIFARIIYGGRTSVAIALIATVASCIVGSILGAVAGYFGKAVDNVIMRALDIFMSVPDILFTMAVVYALGASFTNLIVALLVRSEVLTLSEQDYIEASSAGGATSFRIILSHIIPNAVGVIIINTTLNVAKIIIYESTLSFLGLGMPAPQPEWGQMLSEAREFMRNAPHMMLFPTLAIVIIACAINLVGDGLRDSLDPRLKS